MKIIAVLFFLVTLFPVFSEENQANRSYNFSVGPQFGFIYGQSKEYVYPRPHETKNDLLSELLWDMKPVFYDGVQVNLARRDLMSAIGLFANASFKSGFPMDSGDMENYDWLSRVDANLTHFSTHTNRTKHLFIIDADLGLSIPVMSMFYVKPFISGSWMHFAFSARGGWGKRARNTQFGFYYPMEDDPVYTTFEKNYEVIRYQQNWLRAAPGICIGTNILPGFNFEASFQISPLTYCAAIDTHFYVGRPSRTFHDFTAWGLFFEPKVSAKYTYEDLEFSLAASYRRIGRTTGETYVIDEGSRFYYKSQNESGAGLSILDINLLMVYRF